MAKANKPAQAPAAPAAIVEQPAVETEQVNAAEQTQEAVTEAPAEVVEQPAGDNMVKLLGSNCSVDGNDYIADEDGVVTVQAAHAEVLIRDFGFERV